MGFPDAVVIVVTDVVVCVSVITGPFLADAVVVALVCVLIGTSLVPS